MKEPLWSNARIINSSIASRVSYFIILLNHKYLSVSPSRGHVHPPLPYPRSIWQDFTHTFYERAGQFFPHELLFRFHFVLAREEIHVHHAAFLQNAPCVFKEIKARLGQRHDNAVKSMIIARFFVNVAENRFHVTELVNRYAFFEALHCRGIYFYAHDGTRAGFFGYDYCKGADAGKKNHHIFPLFYERSDARPLGALTLRKVRSARVHGKTAATFNANNSRIPRAFYYFQLARSESAEARRCFLQHAYYVLVPAHYGIGENFLLLLQGLRDFHYSYCSVLAAYHVKGGRNRMAFRQRLARKHEFIWLFKFKNRRSNGNSGLRHTVRHHFHGRIRTGQCDNPTGCKERGNIQRHGMAILFRCRVFVGSFSDLSRRLLVLMAKYGYDRGHRALRRPAAIHVL